MPKFHVLSVSSNAGAVGFHIFGASINRRQHALKGHLKSALTCEQRNILHRSSKRADIIKIKRADVVEIPGQPRPMNCTTIDNVCHDPCAGRAEAWPMTNRLGIPRKPASRAPDSPFL